MPFPIFGCPSRWRTVFNPSTRVSKCGHSGKEIVPRSGSKLRSALGLAPNGFHATWHLECCPHEEKGDRDGEAQSEWDRSHFRWRSEHAPALVRARHPGTDGNKVWLRYGALRRLHRA